MKNVLKTHYECVNFDTDVFMPALSQRLLNLFQVATMSGAPITAYDIVKTITQQLYDYLDANQNIDEAVIRGRLSVLAEAERARGTKFQSKD